MAERWRQPSRDRSAGGSSSDDTRNYSSDRPYGDADYGWGRGREPRRDAGEFDEDWRHRSSSRDYSGVSWGLSGGHRDDAQISPGGGGLEAGYLGYHRDDLAARRRAGHEEYGDHEPMRGEWQREHSGEWWRVPGPHSGRGPRGYQRSDERIREEISDRLTAHGMIDASDVEVTVNKGEVTLEGLVGSRAEKRAAADVADDVHGVTEVHNRLRLRSNAPGDGVGRTSVLGLTESRVQRTGTVGTARTSRSRTRT
jgi:hypothetical protein